MPLTPEAAEPRTATLDLSAHIAGLYDVAAELRTGISQWEDGFIFRRLKIILRLLHTLKHDDGNAFGASPITGDILLRRATNCPP